MVSKLNLTYYLFQMLSTLKIQFHKNNELSVGYYSNICLTEYRRMPFNVRFLKQASLRKLVFLMYMQYSIACTKCTVCLKLTYEHLICTALRAIESLNWLITP